MMSWYKENIEPGITEEVKLLRDNGFNTECSCEHKTYVQCQYLLDGEIKRLHDLLFNNDYRDYTINVNIKVVNGFQYTGLQIDFLDKKRN